MSEFVSIAEAAARLHISSDTVRRRVRRGELVGEQEQTPQGYVWRIAVPTVGEVGEDPGSAGTDGEEAADPFQPVPAPQIGEIRRLEQMIELLQDEVGRLRGELDTRTREVSELHVLLQLAHGRSLPEPMPEPRQEPAIAQAVPMRLRWAFWRRA